jgi:hypothetical protein
MTRCWQAVAAFCALVSVVHAAEADKRLRWVAPKIVESVFSEGLGMLDSERDDCASNLADYATNCVQSAKGDAASLAVAHRFVALAQQLSPKNKRVTALNLELSKGLVPKSVEANYQPPALARVLVARGRLLVKQGGEENQQLARYFVQLAFEIDPTNPELARAAEVFLLENGPVDWGRLGQSGSKKP